MIKKIQFTQDGLKRLQDELAQLNGPKKEKAIDRLQKARAMGDLSENSEYTAAKEDLGFIEGRVRELQEVLKNAEIVQQTTGENTVNLGCRVIVESNGKTEEYAIVGEFEANPMEKRLSQTSPIGKALFGKKKGDSIEVATPAGKRTYKILDILDN